MHQNLTSPLQTVCFFCNPANIGKHQEPLPKNQQLIIWINLVDNQRINVMNVVPNKKYRVVIIKILWLHDAKSSPHTPTRSPGKAMDSTAPTAARHVLLAGRSNERSTRRRPGPKRRFHQSYKHCDSPAPDWKEGPPPPKMPDRF